MKNKWRYINIALIVLILATALYLSLTQASAVNMPALKDGDIVFQTSPGIQSLAIILATDSPYTHMGIVKELPDGEYAVVEAIGPVRETSLQTWIENGIGRRITVKRMENLSPEHAEGLLRHAKTYYGRAYDPFFYFDNEALYCSELVYFAFRDAGIKLGAVQKISDLNINTTAAEKLMEDRWQRHPLCKDGQVADFESCRKLINGQSLITPQSIADDERLITVYSNY